MKNRDNTFVAFLDLLKVKHTRDFSNQYFNEHPYKYSLFGLSKMLSDYGVENAGTRIEDKESDIFNIECPFIAHTGNDFAVVHKVEASLSQKEESSLVHYIWNNKNITLSVSEFIKSWSGIILLAETTPDSIEPEYKEHRKKELLNIAQKAILLLAAILIFGLTYINNSLFTDLGASLLILTNLIGAYISYLLVLKQMRIHSQYADKICSLFSKSDCNDVLESDAAKLWGVFGWSEIGLGYFSANILLILFSPHTLPLLAILNILTLPYSFWSVWYQKVKARQWCPLCLIVQALLWSIFILNCLFGFIRLPEFDLVFLKDTVFAGCVFTGLIFSLNLLIPRLGKDSEIEKVKQEINSLKSNEDIFESLLKKQPAYEVSKTDSKIHFGNLDSPLKIFIFSNPFCNPCAKMHKRVENLLKDTQGNIYIQYIFSSFGPDLDFANKYLIAAYLQKEQNEFERIIADWFEEGKSLKEVFFTGLQLDMADPEIEIEFQKHEAWKERAKLRATPTILVDGYKLPDSYKIEDLRYFTKFNVNVK